MVWTSVELVWQQEGKNVASMLKLAVNQKNQQQRVLLCSVHSDPGKYEDLRTVLDKMQNPNQWTQILNMQKCSLIKKRECSVLLRYCQVRFDILPRLSLLCWNVFEVYILLSSALCSLKLWYSSVTTASHCNLQDRSLQTTRPSCFWQS